MIYRKLAALYKALAETIEAETIGDDTAWVTLGYTYWWVDEDTLTIAVTKDSKMAPDIKELQHADWSYVATTLDGAIVNMDDYFTE